MTSLKLLVHGYVRMEEPDETQIALTCKDLSRFCALSGYRVGSIFIDRGVPDEVFARTGFTGLLDAVRLTHAHAVVVPTLDHLSPDGFVQDALLRMVETTGAQVFAAYDADADEPQSTRRTSATPEERRRDRLAGRCVADRPALRRPSRECAASWPREQR